MGKILASEKQEWWEKLNALHIKFAGTTAIPTDPAEIGEKTKAEQINEFLTWLGFLKQYNYSKAIDWSNYDEEKLKQPGDLIKIITVTNIETTLDRLDATCVYCSEGGGCGYHSDDSHGGCSHRSVCQNYTDNTEKSQSEHSTEPGGHGAATSRSQSHTQDFTNVSHNQNTT